MEFAIEFLDGIRFMLAIMLESNITGIRNTP